MYRHWRVNRMTSQGAPADRGAVPPAARRPVAAAGRLARPRRGGRRRRARRRSVGDYVAGMTDRYAMDEHRRLTDLSVTG